jgi:hypothetical protein
MKALLLSVAACAALGGCATYGDPYGYSYPAYPAVSGSITYQTGPGYYGHGSYPVYPAYQGGGRGMRDRDGDGIPNRMDRDRDGDGVRNRLDDRSNNPRRN